MTDIRLVVLSDDEADLAALAELSELRRVKVPQDEGLALDPLTAAVVIGGGLAIGRFVIHIIDVYRGGVRIDLAVKPPTVERARGVPFGMIVIFTKDGETRIETKDEPKDAVERMVEALLKLPIDATADMIKKALELAKGEKPAPAPAPGGAG